MRDNPFLEMVRKGKADAVTMEDILHYKRKTVLRYKIRSSWKILKSGKSGAKGYGYRLLTG